MFPVVARANRNRLPLYWAAHDLVDYLEKISGVRPVLAAEPQPDTIPVRICVLEDDASLTSQPYAKRVSISGRCRRGACRARHDTTLCETRVHPRLQFAVRPKLVRGPTGHEAVYLWFGGNDIFAPHERTKRASQSRGW
jgi:hypothetical protein